MSNDISAILSHEQPVSKEHITQLVQFITQHQWIYNFQLTKFLSEKVWIKAPDGYLNYLVNLAPEQLRELPYGIVKGECPKSLKQYIETCLGLSLCRTQTDSLKPSVLNQHLSRGLTYKKQHEVANMSSFVHQLASMAEIHHIVDIGSGLGYLDHVLGSMYDYNILGIECSKAFAHKAESRAAQLKFDQDSSCKLSTCALELKQTKESQQEFELAIGTHLLETKSSSICHPIMMIGLHCCGDLTPTMLNFFLQVESVRILTCASCCYHKMDYNEKDMCFPNFPLSTAVKTACSVLQTHKPYCNLNIFAMRLAAQETRTRWLHQTEAEQNYHTKNVAFRGLLEMLLQAEGITPEKHACRVTKKANFATPQSYIDAVITNLQVDTETSEDYANHLRKTFHQLYSENQQYLCFIEPITSPPSPSTSRASKHVPDWLAEITCHAIGGKFKSETKEDKVAILNVAGGGTNTNMEGY